MKIVAVSDIHGSHDRVMALLRKEWPWDGLIVAGDLTTIGTADEVASAVNDLLSFGAPVAAVCGNMDPQPLEQVLAEKDVSVNGRGRTWGTVGIFGVSGSPPTPMHTPNEVPEAEIAQQAEKGWKDVSTAPVTIFVPHAPPRNMSLDKIRTGAHVGSTAVRSFVEVNAPTLVICGHIHESRGVENIGKTTVVNCGPAGAGSYAVITTEPSVTVELKG